MLYDDDDGDDDDFDDTTAAAVLIVIIIIVIGLTVIRLNIVLFLFMETSVLHNQFKTRISE